MCAQRVLFARRYRAALLDYLLGRDEAGLARAYELGRAAMREGLGLLEILRSHQGATQTIVGSTHDVDLTLKTLAAAGEFLMETLSPFEMAYRGYVQADVDTRDAAPGAPSTSQHRRRERHKG